MTEETISPHSLDQSIDRPLWVVPVIEEIGTINDVENGTNGGFDTNGAAGRIS